MSGISHKSSWDIHFVIIFQAIILLFILTLHDFPLHGASVILINRTR